jgi:WD40 repeat protein
MSGDGNATRFELSHDAIARLVFDQASAEAQTRRKIEKYVRDRFAMYRERGALLTRDDLDYIHPHLGAIHADDEERAFIGQSERAVRRTRHRRRLVVAGVMAVLAVSSGVSAMMALNATRSKQLADRARDRAEAARLFNEARTQLASGALLDAVQTARVSARAYPSDPSSTETQYAVMADPTAMLVTIREPLNSSPRVRFSSDGNRILSVSKNGFGSFAARVWDWNRKELFSIPQTIRADFAKRSTALIGAEPGAPAWTRNEDGSSCGDDVKLDDGTFGGVGTLFVVDLAQPAKRDRLPFGFQSMAPNGTRVTVCGTFVSIDDDSGKPLAALSIPGATSAAFTPDGKRIVVSAGSRSAIYDLAGAKLLDVDGASLTVSDDGERLATVEGATTVIRDATGRELARRQGVAPVFGPNGIVLTVTGETSRLRRPDADGTTAMVDFPGTDPRLSPDGKWVMTTLTDRTRIADVAGHELTTLPGVSGRFSPIGPVAMTATESGVIRLWDLRRTPVATEEAGAAIWGLDEQSVKSLAALNGPIGCAFRCVSPDGSLRASVMLMGVTPGAPMGATLRLEVADPRSGDAGAAGWRELPRDAGRNCLGPVSMDVSPVAGGDVVLGCGDGSVRAFDRRGASRWQGQHGGAVTRAAFSPDGRYVLTGSADRTARLWNAATGAVITTFAGHEGDVTSVIVSSNATRAATLTTRGTLRLWQPNAPSAKLLSSVTLDDWMITAIAFSADGSQILARTLRGQLRRWLTDAAELDEEFAWVRTRSDTTTSPDASAVSRP